MSDIGDYLNRIKPLKDSLPDNFDSTDHYLIEKSQLKSSGRSQQSLDFNSTLKRDF